MQETLETQVQSLGQEDPLRAPQPPPAITWGPWIADPPNEG